MRGRIRGIAPRRVSASSEIKPKLRPCHPSGKRQSTFPSGALRRLSPARRICARARSEGGSSSRNSPNSKRGVGIQLNGGGGDNRRCPPRRGRPRKVTNSMAVGATFGSGIDPRGSDETLVPSPGLSSPARYSHLRGRIQRYCPAATPAGRTGPSRHIVSHEDSHSLGVGILPARKHVNAIGHFPKRS